jgi:chorismate mutase/prephenate dehydratase
MSKLTTTAADADLLKGIRQEIDGIDDHLLSLINRRAACAKKVADIKIAAGEVDCFHRPEREAEVLTRMMNLNPGPLSRKSVAKFYRELMSECLALEKPLSVAFLGPEGTFTQQAAFKHFGHAIDALPYPNIDEIFRAVETGASQYGVVPVENSTEGVITHTLDSLLNTPLFIAGEITLRIHHYLMAGPGVTKPKHIYSHQQSLAQCKGWLDRNLPHAERHAVSSNAEAARMVATLPDAAAIAPEISAKLYDLEVLNPHIEDESHNTTRFLVVGRNLVGKTQNDKTSLLIALKNDPGALYGVLEPFARHGISLSKIESRPSRRQAWDYVFFVDVEGHQEDPEVKAALIEVEQNATLLKVLGSYPKALI